MTSSEFRKIRNKVYSLEKKHIFSSGRLIGVVINGVLYSRSKSEGKLSRKQMAYFEYLPDFENDFEMDI